MRAGAALTLWLYTRWNRPRVAPTCDADREDTRVAIRTAGRRLGAVRAEPASALVAAVPRLVLS